MLEEVAPKRLHEASFEIIFFCFSFSFLHQFPNLLTYKDLRTLADYYLNQNNSSFWVVFPIVDC